MSKSSLQKTTVDTSARGTAGERAAKPVPVLTILSHPDVSRIGERAVLRGRGELALSRAEPLFARPGDSGGEPLLDPFISRQPVILKRTAKGIRVDTTGTRTRVRAGDLPVRGATTHDREDLEVGVVLALAERVALFLRVVRPPLSDREEALGMIGAGPEMARIRAEVARLEGLDVPVLLRGETGTGKELLARAIHEHSPRASGKMVSVNLGAIPPGVAAAELFGSIRGAFSGSVAPQTGFFREAHGGTLFLDEIAEASPEIQPMLLRVLETGEIYPVGSQKPVRVDVRLIAATDANLSREAAKGAFRAPLYHRLSTYEILIPPLRDRREDIGRLILHFARQDMAELGQSARLAQEGERPWLPTDLAAALAAYTWPGNIRQLRNVVKQLVIANRGLEQLAMTATVRELLTDRDATVPTQADTNRRKPSTVTTDELVAALERNHWDLLASSKELRISRTSLYALIEQTPGLRIASDLNREEIELVRARYDTLPEMANTLRVSVSGLRQRMVKLGMS